MNPSIVFLGDIFSYNLFFPIDLPTINAKVSLVQTKINNPIIILGLYSLMPKEILVIKIKGKICQTKQQSLICYSQI